MRATVVIASHNEGDRLWRTVQSCRETTRGLDCEVIVADDASTDNSLQELRRRFPEVRVFSRRRRRGVSPTKDLGARESRGRVIVFLDGHCKPERNAIERLIRDVEELNGEAIVTPRVPALDCEKWKSSKSHVGHGFKMALETFDCGWLFPEEMERRGRFYESPALVGCCVAVARRLYLRLRGFDKHMLQWGLEDIDFGLKAWLLGHPVLHDPRAVIGHRFRGSFDNFTVSMDCVLVNKLRMARKNFSDATWKDWVRRQRSTVSRALWRRALGLYRLSEGSVERERRYLLRHRVRTEFDYARRFGLGWPRPPSATEPERAAPKRAAPKRAAKRLRRRGKAR